MFDKEIFNEIKDLSHIDYICIKSKADGLHTDVYYLDGHQIFEKSLTSYDMDFINCTRDIGCYGISEKMIGDNSISDRFYVRVNISNEQQELKLMEYLQKDKKFANEQLQILNHLRLMDAETKANRDYHSLYYCGFSKNSESAEFDSVRFYFKTFGADESLRCDFDWIKYCERCPGIKADETFRIVRHLVWNKQVGLRCIGVDIADTHSIKIKYYLYQTGIHNSIRKLLLELKKYPRYVQNADMLLAIVDDIQDVSCDMLQISGGYADKDGSINLYLDIPKKKKKYYSVKEGLILRNIGGVLFLIDIHEKHYYDLKNLFSVNETGKCIIEYMMNQGVCNLEGIVSHLRSVIKDYNAELYPVIYSDCKMFVEMLQRNGYVQEVM